jgi:acyl transferase domain-containing protein
VGRCKSFDASGDGYGRGEGFAAALLTQARPGQLALAVVRASSVSQDGQSSGLTAPNGPSQTKLVLNALRQGGLAAAALRFVAVHGTGTPLGDPIEVGALGQAARGSQQSSSGSVAAPLVLGSVKSCYGHTEGAAGLTGLLLAAQAAGQGKQGQSEQPAADRPPTLDRLPPVQVFPSAATTVSVISS